MGENAGKGPQKTSFDARIFAIQVCGKKAVDKFREVDRRLGRL